MTPTGGPVLAAAVLLAAAAVLSASLLRQGQSVAIGTRSERAILAETPTSLAVWRWDRDPAVVVLDFPSLEQQGRMLDRIAALVEKRGEPHDRVLDDAGLARAIAESGATVATYYEGHDYPAADLVRFFALADRDHVRLNAEEHRLCRLLRTLGWTGRGPGAVISLPAATGEVSIRTRAAILHHELSHGVFFTLPAYADRSRLFWRDELTASERAGFRDWLGAEGYDPALEPLMLNEAQAYLVWTPDRDLFRPEQAGLAPARAAALRAAFLRGLPTDARVEELMPP